MSKSLEPCTKPFEKQVKRRGRRIMVSQETLFCPPFMVRCDNNRAYFNYSTLWACRICTKTLLSKAAAISHAAKCKLTITKEKDIQIADLENMEKNMCYPCKYCDKKMRRKVNWLKHLNEHETPEYDENKWGVNKSINKFKLPDQVVSTCIKQDFDLSYPSTSK
ncbi:serendipity locus protein beta-like [Melanaphis sacchari]|uniref:serendipity locus protein beta-like n=1 Tax=Melanaphis sacchari TaxID=742174 RepID=UPI000DC14BFB|nr:serendipity locus protein beta-like [Melanaphis sacchari]